MQIMIARARHFYTVILLYRIQTNRAPLKNSNIKINLSVPTHYYNYTDPLKCLDNFFLAPTFKITNATRTNLFDPPPPTPPPATLFSFD